MTRPCEFNRLRDLIDDARVAGFEFRDTSDGRVDIVACAGCYPGLVDDVAVHRTPSLEEALRFVDGVRWYHQYLRLRGN